MKKMICASMRHARSPRLPGVLLAGILCFSALSGCASGSFQDRDTTRRTSFFAMDTVMDLTVCGGPDSVCDDAEALVRTLEGEFSVTDPSSEVFALNEAGTGAVGSDTGELLLTALSLSERTGGALDCTIYPVLRAWGFTTGDYRVPTEEEIGALLPLVDWTTVRYSADDGVISLAPGQMLDFGAVAKGYAADRLIALFREAGVTSALVNLGGNVQTLGKKPDGSLWRVAVADPYGNGYAGIVETADSAVVTSGGYERYFEADGRIYRHILDPETGYPAEGGLVSVTIVGSGGVICDGLSTALYVMGTEGAAEFWRSSSDFEAILLTEEGEILLTEDLESAFTPAGDWANAPLTVIRHD